MDVLPTRMSHAWLSAPMSFTVPRVPAISVRTRIRLQAHIAAVQAEFLGCFLVWPDGFEVPRSALRAFGSADGARLLASRLWESLYRASDN